MFSLNNKLYIIKYETHSLKVLRHQNIQVGDNRFLLPLTQHTIVDKESYKILRFLWAIYILMCNHLSLTNTKHNDT